jgi:four helix bundle protein
MQDVRPQSKTQGSKEQVKYKAYYFSISIIKFVSTLPQTKVYLIIIDQLVRSATSIGANIVEAQASSSKRDFYHFFEIALKSANETKYWLAILRDGLDVNKETIEPFLNELTSIANILGASILTMKNKR